MSARRLLPALLAAFCAAPAAAQKAEPLILGNRKAETGCVWSKLSDPKLGLELLHERCDFGFRKIDHQTAPDGRAVYEVWTSSKGKSGGTEALIELYDKTAEETPEAAIKRLVFPSLTRAQRKHCAVTARTLGFLGKGKLAYTIKPDEELASEVLKKAGDGVPEPACGERGDSPDGLSYFEFHPAENAKRFVFVAFGQDEHPLFDETSLKFLP